MKVLVEPTPVIGALIACLGLVVAFVVMRFVPEFISAGVSGAITGGFGVLALQRVWPGLPMHRFHWVVGALVVYGLLVGIVGRL